MTSPAEALLDRRPLIIGHRGYCSIAPENTLPSFQLALGAGADLVELDYQHSKDGVPMVIHDRMLTGRPMRGRNGSGGESKFRRKPRRKFKRWMRGVGSTQSLPERKFCGWRQRWILFAGNDGVPLIEHKSGDAETLTNILRERRLINKVVVISFDWRFLRELHALEPAQVLGALGPPVRLSNGRRPLHPRRQLGSRLKDLAKTGARIAVWNRKVSNRGVRRWRKRGREGLGLHGRRSASGATISETLWMRSSATDRIYPLYLR